MTLSVYIQYDNITLEKYTVDILNIFKTKAKGTFHTHSDFSQAENRHKCVS